MKRKGFTLVELLIVVAIIGVLGSMMMMSSTDAVDSAGANAILSNLNTMKTAAMSMYMEDTEVASQSPIALNGTDGVGSEGTVKKTLAKYLGKSSTAIGLGDQAGQYGLVGSDSAWYVVYQFATTDTTGVKTKLAASSSKADLFCATDAPEGKTGTDDDGTCGFSTTAYYNGGTNEAYIGLRVR